MLYIVQKGIEHPVVGLPAKVADRVNEWHVGEPLPQIKTRVVDFRADGDELIIILDALAATVWRTK